ncbi:MAG: hypothetical protein RLZZ86_4089 [Cyanobacteriota bacterium]
MYLSAKMSPITWQKLLTGVKITIYTDKGSTPNGKFTAPMDTEEEGKISWYWVNYVNIP